MSRLSRLAAFSLLPFLMQCRSSGGSLGPTPVTPQTEAGASTTYELLEPTTHKFRITHEVAATTPEARTYCAYVRPGIFIEGCQAFDTASGAELAVQLVDARTAHERGVADALEGEKYILVGLARPVPLGGQSRVRIAITYLDREAYRFQGDEIGFERTLAAKRVSVVLPEGYSLERCNAAVEVETLPDARVAVHLWKASNEAVTLKILGRRARAWRSAAAPAAREMELRAARARDAEARAAIHTAGTDSGPDDGQPRAPLSRPNASSTEQVEAVCVLDAPESNRFRLLVDRTLDSAPSTEIPGAVFVPSESLGARVLDSGLVLPAEVVTRTSAAGQRSSVIVTDLPGIASGQSLRLRLEALVRDPARYWVRGDEAHFTLSISSERLSVLLPADRRLSACSPAATIQDLPDGSTRLDFVNAAGGSLAVEVSSRPR